MKLTRQPMTLLTMILRSFIGIRGDMISSKTINYAFGWSDEDVSRDILGT